MPRTAFRRVALTLLVATTAHCGYDTSAPGTYDPPGPGGAPGTNDPPTATVNDGLWTVGGVEAAILRLAPPQLLTSDTVSAATTVRTTTATLFTLNGVAFDDAGTLWIASRDDSLVLAFTQSTLATSGIREASRVIASTSRSLRGATALAFDRKHRLWVADIDDGTIVRLDSAQIGSSGAPVPAKVVRVGGGQPAALAFDDFDGHLRLAQEAVAPPEHNTTRPHIQGLARAGDGPAAARLLRPIVDLGSVLGTIEQLSKGAGAPAQREQQQ